MKKIWVRIVPWDKQLAIAALERGADAVVLSEGDASKMKELGRMPVIAPDGDVRLGRDVVEMKINSKEDEERAAAAPAEKTLVLRMKDWTIIPLENLIAQRGKLMVEVGDSEAAQTAIGVLEKGVDGVVLSSREANEVRRTVRLVHGAGETVALAEAVVTDVLSLGMGDRVCIDTCTHMTLGQGMLVGNTTEGFLLVHSETVENPYVAARPFRVNAGAVHAYCLAPGGKTRYLSELRTGDPVLLVNYEGKTDVAYIGRCKVERRPMLLIKAEAEGRSIGLVLQNAETIRLTVSGGSSVSVAALKPGDKVLAHLMGGGRHFGIEVEETLDEK